VNCGKLEVNAVRDLEGFFSFKLSLSSVIKTWAEKLQLVFKEEGNVKLYFFRKNQNFHLVRPTAADFLPHSAPALLPSFVGVFIKTKEKGKGDDVYYFI